MNRCRTPARVVAWMLLAACLLPAAARAEESLPQTPRAALTALLDAGLARDFERYLAVLHPDQRETPSQREHRRRTDWTRFQGHASWYVRAGKPSSFSILRLESGKDTRKVFLRDFQHRKRMPVPVHLRRHQGGWTVENHSL